MEGPEGILAETSYHLMADQPIRAAAPDAPTPIAVPVEIQALDRLLYTAAIAR